MQPHLSRLNYLQQAMPATAFRQDATPRSGGILRNWTRASVRRWQRRKMVAALHAMDDYLLRDIGIDRQDIQRVVDGFDARELRMTPLARTTPSREQGVEQEVYRQAA